MLLSCQCTLKHYVPNDSCEVQPSVRTFVAFCSEMPLICSSIFFGLKSPSTPSTPSASVSLRVCNRFHGVVSTFDE